MKVILTSLIASSLLLFSGCTGVSVKSSNYKLRYGVLLRTILLEGVEVQTNGIITIEKIYSFSDKEALKFIAEGAVKGVNPLP